MNMMANFAVTWDTKGQNENPEGDRGSYQHIHRIHLIKDLKQILIIMRLEWGEETRLHIETLIS